MPFLKLAKLEILNFSRFNRWLAKLKLICSSTFSESKYEINNNLDDIATHSARRKDEDVVLLVSEYTRPILQPHCHCRWRREPPTGCNDAGLLCVSFLKTWHEDASLPAAHLFRSWCSGKCVYSANVNYLKTSLAVYEQSGTRRGSQ